MPIQRGNAKSGTRRSDYEANATPSQFVGAFLRTESASLDAMCSRLSAFEGRNSRVVSPQPAVLPQCSKTRPEGCQNVHCKLENAAFDLVQKTLGSAIRLSEMRNLNGKSLSSLPCYYLPTVYILHFYDVGLFFQRFAIVSILR